MKSIEESVVMAMDGSGTELYPFIPYIFQDIWEIGSSPDVMVRLIGRHIKTHDHLEVLDLGCGKGAVSIRVSDRYRCKCHGIDAVPEFISYARKKAVEYHVGHLCRFETGDIRERIRELNRFDIIILGALGPVFGDYFTTLSTLSCHLKESGIILVDDGYVEDSSDFAHPLILKKRELLEQIHSAGMKLVENDIMKSEYIKDSDEFIFKKLKNRCQELMKKYPEKRGLFENYIKKQTEENDVLENKTICTTMVIKRA